MPDPFNLSYKEQAFLIHIIGHIGADLQAKEGWTDLKVKQTLDFALIPSSFFGAYKNWPDEYKEDVSRIINGERPNQPLSIMQRAYDNAYRIAEQRIAQLRPREDFMPAGSGATAIAAANTPKSTNRFWTGFQIGAGLAIMSAILFWQLFRGA